MGVSPSLLFEPHADLDPVHWRFLSLLPFLSAALSAASWCLSHCTSRATMLGSVRIPTTWHVPWSKSYAAQDATRGSESQRRGKQGPSMGENLLRQELKRMASKGLQILGPRSGAVIKQMVFEGDCPKHLQLSTTHLCRPEYACSANGPGWL